MQIKLSTKETEHLKERLSLDSGFNDLSKDEQDTVIRVLSGNARLSDNTNLSTKVIDVAAKFLENQ